VSDDVRETNRAHWDALAAVHGQDAYYDAEALIGGADTLRGHEDAAVREAVGEVAGLDVLHLQCHIGFDSISLARRGARVTGADFSPASLAKARDLAERAGVEVEFVEADATALPPELEGFDRALVDAPCSGLGVLAARPDLRWRARPLPDLQLALLSEAATRTRPGGTVVYAVCTINTDENEAVVEASGLEVDPLGEEWPQFAHPKRPEFLLTRPDLHRTSGFFIARLKAS
jgi:16S rRNA C967 or C1407 C5-methylase (RsmB/RsmF family)